MSRFFTQHAFSQHFPLFSYLFLPPPSHVTVTPSHSYGIAFACRKIRPCSFSINTKPISVSIYQNPPMFLSHQHKANLCLILSKSAHVPFPSTQTQSLSQFIKFRPCSFPINTKPISVSFYQNPPMFLSHQHSQSLSQFIKIRPSSFPINTKPISVSFYPSVNVTFYFHLSQTMHPANKVLSPGKTQVAFSSNVI